MSTLKSRLLFICLWLLSSHLLDAQDLLLTDDSLTALLKNKYVSISPEKIRIVIELMSRILPEESHYDSLKNRIIADAEESRNRFLICMTYNEVGMSYLGYFQKPEYYEKGIVYVDKCMQIATESGLNNFKVASLLSYSRYYINLTQYQKALDENNQAIALASTLGSDSLLSLAYSSIANAWYALSNKLSEFQALINAREFAEKSRISTLINECYFSLGNFYEETTDYEKAKDYYTLCVQQGRQSGNRNLVFNSLQSMGRIYFAQKMEPLGILYYDKTQKYADSLGIPSLKLRVYFDLLNYYFHIKNPVKGFVYLNSHPEIMAFIKDYGIEFQVNKLYAELEKIRGNYDSALYYLKIAAPFEYGQKANYREKYNFMMQLAEVFKLMSRLEDEKRTLLLAKKFADSSHDLHSLKEVTLELDSAYQCSGDYKNAQIYLQQYDIYRDSIEALGRQKDVLNIEIENATKRAEQQKLADAETKRLRNNVEYLGITAALATVFIILVILGVFRISPTVIKALGFFAFIFLFEFIVLLLDNQIHELTGGEPWKVLGVKIIIIALLLPLHHWLEERMLHYLTFRAHKIKSKIFDKK